jgi:hypothetical protein
MSGRAGLRGYLIQAIICLLNSVESDDEWLALSLEPDLGSDKVDIARFYSGGQMRVTQVKSSQNQIGRKQVIRWAAELEQSVEAIDYELILIGPCSQSVATIKAVGKVRVPTPKTIAVDSLLAEAAHEFDKYLEKSGIPRVVATGRELLVRALVTEMEAFSTSGKPMTREEFNNLLRTWISKAMARLETEQEKARRKAVDIEMLQSLQEELVSVEGLYFHHPAFQAWHEKTKTHLGEIFDKDADIVARYHRIAWWTSDDPKHAEQQRDLFSNCCQSAKGLLAAAVSLRQSRP